MSRDWQQDVANELYGMDPIKLWLGQRAEQYQGSLFLMKTEPFKGMTLTIVGGIIAGYQFDPTTEKLGTEMESMEGRIILVPTAKATGKEFRGHGAAAMLTDGAFNPRNWSVPIYGLPDSK
jgi:hypothetical protein